MKSIVVPMMDSFLEYQKLGVKSFLLPLKHYSVSYPKVYSLEEIEMLKGDNPNLEFFVVMNKTIFNKDIDKLVDVVKRLEKLQIQGIFFYDLALLELKHRLQLKTPLVWNQTHMVTNSKTCNYYFRNQVDYAVISGELEKTEIYDLISNTKIKLFYTLLSYPIVAHSKRSLLTNYAKISKLEKKNFLKIHEKISDQDYLLTETEDGTSFFYNQIPNHFSVLENLSVDYVILNESYIEHSLFMNLLAITNQYLHQEVSFNVMLESANQLLDSPAPFLDHKTIYCVKKEGKE